MSTVTKLGAYRERPMVPVWGVFPSVDNCPHCGSPRIEEHDRGHIGSHWVCAPCDRVLAVCRYKSTAIRYEGCR